MFQKILVAAMILHITNTELKDTMLEGSKVIIERAFDMDLNSFLPIRMKKVFSQMEKRRQRIKKAFYKFITEAFFEDEIGNSTAILRTNKDVEYSMSTPELIALHGYKVESFTVLTKDGYLLALHRIPSKNGLKDSKLTLLLHGLLGSSDDWILLGPNRALPYLLSDAGYDVWLANARGNRYSRIHSSRNVNSHEFWNFSWHEIGSSDLAAVIDFIIGITENKTRINFIGHSMGATAVLVLLTIHPEYNNVLRSATLLAPLAFMYHIKGPLRTIAAFQSNHSDDTLTLLGNKELLPIDLPKRMMEQFCKGDKRLCDNLLLLITNGQNINNITHMENILGHLPAGGSTRTILHYAQLVMSGKFQQFDYGLTQNLITYGDTVPPAYCLSHVATPVAVISSTDDWLSTEPDIGTLLHRLSTDFIHRVVKTGFSHMDFVLGEEAPEIVYSLVLDILE